MVRGRLRGFSLVIGLASAVAAGGCFLSQDQDEESAKADDEITNAPPAAAVLNSTLILAAGCTAAKVGPRHLLLAARCVSGNAAFQAGKAITFKVAMPAKTTVAAAGTPDSGKPPNKSTTQATIASVEINASYVAKCKGDACAFRSLAASDAKDVAVIVLDADLVSVPTIPVDLDAVGQSDSLRALGSGCPTFDGKPATTGLKSVKTIAVPAKSVSHKGSPYVEQPALVTRLNGAYVVTPGHGWRTAEAHLCKSDIGAPLFRGNIAAVAGVTSNFSTYEPNKLVPVTVHHTRVDATSKVGKWLASLGVTTTYSCSKTTTGCVKLGYDGGTPMPTRPPAAPAPTDASAPIPPTTVDAGNTTDSGDAGDGAESDDKTEVPVASGEDDSTSSEEQSEDDDAGSTSTKAKPIASSGCSASEGTMPFGSGGIVLTLGIALAAAARRRRRA